ncbi:MAG: YfcE family phosphodiesterase [Promethearchaeota archaeon]
MLVFGDAHIPSRRDSIPSPFYAQIESSHYDLALVTGDLIREEEMRAAMPDLPRCYMVQGNMDYGRAFNIHEQVEIEELSFLLLHGTQLRPRGNIKQLWEIMMNVGADVGIHGHTHEPAIDLYEGKLILNPGTISGATGGWSGVQDASFMDIEVVQSVITVNLHYTDWHVVKSSEARFEKVGNQMVRS